MRNFVLAGTLAGFGGTLNGLALGHVDPFFAYWTTSGEVVFVAVLGGYASTVAVFGAALITELVRSFANQYFPESWQMALGLFLLVVILFLPTGFGSLWAGRGGRRPHGANDSRAVPRVLPRGSDSAVDQLWVSESDVVLLPCALFAGVVSERSTRTTLSSSK